MAHIVVIFVAALVLSWWLHPWMARRAAHWGLMDHPDGLRKLHGLTTPTVGGLAMFLAWGLTLPWMGLPLHEPRYWTLLVALFPLVGVGLWDDRRGLRVRYRFLVQFSGALLLVVVGGVSVHHLGDLVGLGPLGLGGFHGLFSVLCVVGVINAVNMIDGMDGLSGTLVLVALVASALAAGRAGATDLVFMAVSLIAVLLPFLYFNSRLLRPRATLFMGDAGSMGFGLILAWFMVELTQRPGAIQTPATALWLLAVPLIDMFSAFFRRILAGAGPFSPDRKHLHHFLLHRGHGVNGALLRLLGAAVIGAGVALLAPAWQGHEPVLFLGLVIVWLGYLGYSERYWRLARKVQGDGRSPSEDRW
ncbi:MAG: undecaprenyl/decaprenyl-phosphate alpha-N-acetylglucosaminyl 1-phosphate transferase [Magnetococcus sp. WYHC-3]